MIERPAFANLLRQHSRFVGRAREIAEIKRLLLERNGEATSPLRLLTLTGPGGIGKTRLALRVAEELAFEDKVYPLAQSIGWVDLAPLSDPALVPQAIASALQVGEQRDRPPVETLSEWLAPQSFLLIFDNCEHLRVACAELANTLLQACPGLTILATSREALGLAGETVFVVPPLSLPAPEDRELSRITDSDAVSLFMDRASGVVPHFALNDENVSAVTQVCRQLDGLPLAIELAAARVLALTVSQIAERLEDSFRLLTRAAPGVLPRHHTLRAAIDWSYNLLLQDEQALFCRLSVFAGEFTLEGAEAVCTNDAGRRREADGQNVHPPDILDVLSSLIGKSLVIVSGREEIAGARYRMLETVRQYAREKLEATGEAAESRTRHLEWYTAWAEKAEPELTGSDQVTWLSRLEAEHDNIRTALQWALEGSGGPWQPLGSGGSPNRESGLRLAAALSRFWIVRGYFSEGRRWLEELMGSDVRAAGTDLISSHVAPSVRARALWATAALAYHQGDYRSAFSLGEASLDIRRELQDRENMATTLNLLGVVATSQDDYDRAVALHQEALELRRELGDQWGIGTSLTNLGEILLRRGEFRQAQALFEESLMIKRQLGDKSSIALLLDNLGNIERGFGNYPRAAALYEEALAVARALGGKRASVSTLTNLGVVMRYLGDPERAAALHEEARNLAQELGDNQTLGMALGNLGDLARDQGDFGRASMLFREALALFEPTGSRWGIALSWLSLGTLARLRGDLARAEELCTSSLSLYREIGDKVGIIRGLEGLASVAWARSQHARAVQLVSAAAREREAISLALTPHEEPVLNEIRGRARAALGETVYRNVQAQGQAMTREAAVQDALTPLSSCIPNPTLSISALGPARVERGGDMLTSSDWTYAKARELLFYLLEHPANTKEQIGLALWPDASPMQLRNNLHTVLHQMRRALGHADWIVFDENRYSFNRALSYTYDREDFESHLEQANRLLRAGNPGETEAANAIAHLRDAVHLYRGDYLADIEGGEWIVYRREELRRAYLEAMFHLAELIFAGQRYGEAAEIYRQILAQDNYLEQAHRELMRCYARLGEPGQALRHYQGLQTLLRAELGTHPAPETTALVERLRAGQPI